MKIYFDGCSWTFGDELEERSQRFSSIVCQKLDAEEYNISKCGSSNDRIVRQLLVENDITDYDLAVIQMTIPSRTEYHDTKWRGVHIQGTLLWKPWKDKKRIPHVDHWTYYYDKIYGKYSGEVKEKIAYQTIKNHCKVKNVPLILMTINWETNLTFDMELDIDKYPRARGSHPNSEGHRIIAEDILSLLTKHK